MQRESRQRQGSPTFLQMELASTEAVAAELRRGLLAPRAAIPPRFFYDELGSRLFASITALPEYYPTRTEARLLQQHLPAITAAAPVQGATLIDLGAGNCEKAATLFAAVRPTRYVAVDISVEFVRDALRGLQLRFPELPLIGVGTDFSHELVLPDDLDRERPLFFYPGSSIGNSAPAAATAFLASVRRLMGHDGVLWLGVDLQKDKSVLERAYDDELGVTAAFNRNVLHHVNRLASTDFKLADWRHAAHYDEVEHRIEMHLQAVRETRVTWPGGQRSFAAGERVHTENSYKYSIAGCQRLLAAAGLRCVGHWTDPQAWFGFFVAIPDRP